MKTKKLLSLVAAMCLTFQAFPMSNLSAEDVKSEEGFIYGDVNGNGIADLSDLSMLSLHLIKDITLEGNAFKAADTDGNHQVNLGDLAHFRRFLSKNITKLGPAEEKVLNLKPASDYTEVYSMLDYTKGDDNYYSEDYFYNTAPTVGGTAAPGAAPAITTTAIKGEVPATLPVAMPTAAPTRAPGGTSVNNGGMTATPSVDSPDSTVSKDYSDTYNQEENVIEADIVKTDGKTIFSLTQGGNPVINAVRTADGKFESGHRISIDLSDCSIGNAFDINAEDMYLYNDRIIVTGTAYVSTAENDISLPWYARRDKPVTFVSAYTKGDDENAPELIDTYYQEGYYNDVRITPDGYMYLVSDGYFAVNKSEEWSIPTAGTAGNGISQVKCDSIYIPEDCVTTHSRSYTIIGSIDLNSADEVKKSDVKVMAGFTGEIYCSEKNLYLTNEKYNYRYNTDEEDTYEKPLETTEITRVSLSEGSITPEASAEVAGSVKDQFSMSEYNGHFRVVTTADYDVYNAEDDYYEYEQSNNVFVFDMDLKKTGELTHFAREESVKSVSFAGDMVYVVTYVQIDPLFSIDLSDPEKPVILDEYKIDGYSTYMQKWDENHLLGFGLSTHDNGYGGEARDGYKLVMFDNSDPENLKEVGVFKVLHNDMKMISLLTDTPESELSEDISSIYFYSDADYERKELLIAPEKNLIGFPVQYDCMTDSSDDKNVIFDRSFGSGYMLFSYDNNEFTLKNFLGDKDVREYGYYTGFGLYNRAVYIGDYVYIVSDGKLMSADIETGTKVDEIVLDSENDYSANDYLEIDDIEIDDIEIDDIEIDDIEIDDSEIDDSEIDDSEIDD